MARNRFVKIVVFILILMVIIGLVVPMIAYIWSDGV
jgi:hypothetical protein